MDNINEKNNKRHKQGHVCVYFQYWGGEFLFVIRIQFGGESWQIQVSVHFHLRSTTLSEELILIKVV